MEDVDSNELAERVFSDVRRALGEWAKHYPDELTYGDRTGEHSDWFVRQFENPLEELQRRLYESSGQLENAGVSDASWRWDGDTALEFNKARLERPLSCAETFKQLRYAIRDAVVAEVGWFLIRELAAETEAKETEGWLPNVNDLADLARSLRFYWRRYTDAKRRFLA